MQDASSPWRRRPLNPSTHAHIASSRFVRPFHGPPLRSRAAGLHNSSVLKVRSRILPGHCRNFNPTVPMEGRPRCRPAARYMQLKCIDFRHRAASHRKKVLDTRQSPWQRARRDAPVRVLASRNHAPCIVAAGGVHRFGMEGATPVGSTVTECRSAAALRASRGPAVRTPARRAVPRRAPREPCVTSHFRVNDGSTNQPGRSWCR